MKFICVGAKAGKFQEAGDFFFSLKKRTELTEIKFGRSIQQLVAFLKVISI